MTIEKNYLRAACKKFEEDLVLYYYGESPERESERVEAHLKGCGSCRLFLEDLRGFLPLTEAPKELPQTFWDGYYRELRGKLEALDHRKTWWRSLFSGFYPMTIPAIGTALVLILALTLTFSKGMWHSGSQATQETLPPAIQTVTSNIDFFESIDMLESIDLLEALDGNGSGHHGRQAGQNL